jgi:hypothetical protein
MPPRARTRSSDGGPSRDAASARRPDPVLLLQRAIGNRAVGQVLSRTPATKDNGTVQVGKLSIKIAGGNAGDWAAKKDPDTLEISSEPGKHSAELEKLSKSRTRIPSLKVTTPAVDANGEHLNYGSVQIEFVNARIAGYSSDGTLETWRAVDFESAHRTTITRKAGV